MAEWSKDKNDKIMVGRGILRKLLPGGVWHFFHKNDAGRWVSTTTGHRDRAGAITWAQAFSLDETRRQFGVTTKVVRVNDDANSRLDEWLAYQRTQNSRYTVRTYSSIVKKFKKFLSEKAKLRRLRDINSAVMMDYRAWALALGNERVTVDNNLIALRSFFSWAESKGLVTSNPVSQRRHGEKLFFDAESPRKATFTVPEYEAIRTAAAGVHRTVFVILANTGLRSTEMAMLEWSDIDWSNNLLHVRSKTTADGQTFVPKDKTDRTVPLTPAVRQTLEQLAAPAERTGYVIPLQPVKVQTGLLRATLPEGPEAAARRDRDPDGQVDAAQLSPVLRDPVRGQQHPARHGDGLGRSR